MTEEQPQSHFPRWYGVEAALDGEIGEIRTDGLVQVQQTALHGQHDGRRGEILGGRLDAENGVLADPVVGLGVGDTESFDPDGLALVNETNGGPGMSSLAMMARMLARS
jgi:hypothetical protein